VRTGAHVEMIRPGEVIVGGQTIPSENIIWAAGVSAEPITRRLGVETDKGGRIKILPDLSITGHPEAFAIGDIVTLKDANGIDVPGVAQGAMQMGRHVSHLIECDIRGEKLAPAGRKPFAYYDKGSLATIGRSAAVAEIKHWKLTGFVAWVVWLVVHLLFLIGFRNKFSVLMQWMYSYVTFKRGARIITGVSGERSAGSA
jgi:NADH dehydrogenase